MGFDHRLITWRLLVLVVEGWSLFFEMGGWERSGITFDMEGISYVNCW